MDIFGTLQAARPRAPSNVSSGTANTYTVNLHPGSVLWLDNDASNYNRWADNVGINLNGGQLPLAVPATTAAVTSTETVGAITFSWFLDPSTDMAHQRCGAVDRGQPADLTRAGVGNTGHVCLNWKPSSVSTAPTVGSERFMVTAWTCHAADAFGTVNRNVTPGFANNGILPAYYIDATNEHLPEL